MTRIIGGKAGSLRINTPGSHTRPTSDRVREAWFSALDARGLLEGASVLDGYAGSGALGLEAASRGAQSVVFVDSHSGATRVITANTATLRNALGPDTTLHVHTGPVATYLATSPRVAFDLVFLDPPYDVTSEEVDSVLVAVSPAVAPEGLVMLERSSRSAPPTWPPGMEPEKPRKYGETTLYFATKS